MNFDIEMKSPEQRLWMAVLRLVTKESLQLKSTRNPSALNWMFGDFNIEDRWIVGNLVGVDMKVWQKSVAKKLIKELPKTHKYYRTVYRMCNYERVA